MTQTESTEEATQTEPVDQRPRLLSVDVLTSDYLFGLPLLAWAWIALTQSPLRNAISLGLYVVWVLGDLAIYRIRHRAMPPRPTWGKHNRWTVPLLFIVLIVGAIQGI
ncbi:MAG: hypothetical protein OXN44_12495 [Acidimicrobiaceae bacterium]|nr:hypothetical protein [Acidimicrobiaceae bacterium]